MTVLPDPPDFVTPGQPVEALWGNEVVAWVREAVQIVNTIMPIGIVGAYGGVTEPVNWLFCRGQAISQTTYSALYAVIGGRFNTLSTPPAAGLFRVPNLQARYPVGFNAGSADAELAGMWATGVGETRGDYTPVMPNHNHTVPDHLHSLNLNTGGHNTNHVHADDGVGAYAMEGTGAFGIPLHYLPVGVGTDIGGPHWFHFAPTTGAANTDHYHGVNGWTGAADRSLSSGFAGGGAQVPPGVSFNFIIRAN